MGRAYSYGRLKLKLFADILICKDFYLQHIFIAIEHFFAVLKVDDSIFLHYTTKQVGNIYENFNSWQIRIKFYD